MHRNRRLPVTGTCAALVLWVFAAARGYAWQLIWLPAAVAAAVWPHDHTRTLEHCLRQLRRQRNRPA